RRTIFPSWKAMPWRSEWSVYRPTRWLRTGIAPSTARVGSSAIRPCKRFASSWPKGADSRRNLALRQQAATRSEPRARTTTDCPKCVFDQSEIADPLGYGERAVKFLRLLKHPKSRLPGRAFDFPRWQERIVRKIYGPCHSDGRRIVRNVVMLLPRG